jgi:molybdate transport system substrate-binding protein
MEGRYKKKKWLKLLITALIVTAIAFSSAGCTKAKVESEPVLIVAAASDLLLAFQEIGELFTRETGVEVKFNFGSTGLLAQQIANGAPIDVFAAANIAFVDKLREQGMIIDDTQQLYARGRIVVAKQKGSDPGFSWKELADNESWELLNQGVYKKLAIASPDHAPYGTAAKEFLISTNNWYKVEERLVYGSNIRDALKFVLSGNAEVAIIALSIVDKSEVDYILIPEELHLPLNQAMAVIKSTKFEQEARAFSEYVLSDRGKAILGKYGFIIP